VEILNRVDNCGSSGFNVGGDVIASIGGAFWEQRELSKRKGRPAFLIERGALALSPGKLDGPSLRSIWGTRQQSPTD